MSRLTGVILVAVTMFLVSCGGGGGKFTGKWRDVSEEKGPVIVIKKQGQSYDVYPEDRPEEFMAFTYDGDRDILTTTQGNDVVDIRYDKKNKVLNIAPRGDDRAMVLTKVK